MDTAALTPAVLPFLISLGYIFPLLQESWTSAAGFSQAACDQGVSHVTLSEVAEEQRRNQPSHWIAQLLRESVNTAGSRVQKIQRLRSCSSSVYELKRVCERRRGRNGGWMFLYSCSVLSRYENQITILSDYLEEFPETDEPVWILGRQHHLNAGICKIHL